MSLLAVGQAGITDELVVGAARFLALTIVAGFFGLCVGLVYRWYAAEQCPDGLSVLVGVSVVAIYLNTVGALGDIGGQQALIAAETAVFNTLVFLAAGFAAVGGNRFGDRAAASLFALSGGSQLDRDIGRLVKSVGRVTTVELPSDIDDIVGYDPVDPETKTELAGRTLLFPRRLTAEELRTRFEERLRTDYGVGHIDVEFDEYGRIEYLALGSRAAGLGPTLQTGNAAVAVRADPPNNASAGDIVQVWSTDSEGERSPERVASGELRGTADDIVTLSLDAAAAKSLTPDETYRLVTTPVQPRADREFARQLRAADETMTAVVVDDESPLVGTVLDDLSVAVAAIRTADGDIEVVPSGTRPLAAGETVYAIGHPGDLRRFEQAIGSP